MSYLELYEEFTTCVADVSRPDGIGYVEGPNTIIKAGPLSCSSGKEVEAMLVSKEHAVCLTNSAVADNYGDYLNMLAEEYDMRQKVQGNSVLMPGDTFTSKIDRIRSDNIGVVKNNMGEDILVGPVRCGTGKKVELEYLGGNIAKCLDKQVSDENYEVRLNILSENYGDVPVSIGERYTSQVINSFSESSTVGINNVHVHLNKSDLRVGESVSIEVTGFATQSALGKFIERAGNAESKNINSDDTGLDGIGTSDDIGGKANQIDSLGSSINKKEADIDYREARRRERDHTFAQMVKKAYQEKCAVCGKRRASPDGNPEAEAAHIHPKGEGGPDDIQNGIALCKLHHWAFDSGWISLTEDYEVVVRDRPERDGYSDLIGYEGTDLHLPDDSDKQPQVDYIIRHRELHGFDS